MQSHPANSQSFTPAVQRQNFLLACRAWVRVGIDFFVTCVGLLFFGMVACCIDPDLQPTLGGNVVYFWICLLVSAGVVSSVSVWATGQRRNLKTSLRSLLIFVALLFVPLVIPTLRPATTVSLMFAPWAIVSLLLIAADGILTKRALRLGELPQSRTTMRTQILRAFAIPFCFFMLLVSCAFCWMIGRAIYSTTWPQAQACVSCELVCDTIPGETKTHSTTVFPCTQYDVNYQFTVDGQSYTGNDDGFLKVKEHSFSTRANQRVAELNRNSNVMVSYHPDDPTINTLTTGINCDFFMSQIQQLYVFGLFLNTLAWLLMVHRRVTDNEDVSRTFPPSVLILQFVLFFAFAAAIFYYVSALFLPGIWAFALITWISLSYTMGKRIKAIANREVENKLKDGKLVAWGLGHEFERRYCLG